MNQKFAIHLTLETECKEKVTSVEVRKWMEDILNGCDMGSVSIEYVRQRI